MDRCHWTIGSEYRTYGIHRSNRIHWIYRLDRCHWTHGCNRTHGLDRLNWSPGNGYKYRSNGGDRS
jgi:hypothetical protein